MTSIDVYPLTRAITLSRTERVTLSKKNLGRAIGQSTYQSRLLARGMPDCPMPFLCDKLRITPGLRWVRSFRQCATSSSRHGSWHTRWVAEA